jgi:hypothetical protein
LRGYPVFHGACAVWKLKINIRGRLQLRFGCAICMCVFCHSFSMSFLVTKTQEIRNKKFTQMKIRSRSFSNPVCLSGIDSESALSLLFDVSQDISRHKRNVIRVRDSLMKKDIVLIKNERCNVVCDDDGTTLISGRPPISGTVRRPSCSGRSRDTVILQC